MSFSPRTWLYWIVRNELWILVIMSPALLFPNGLTVYVAIALASLRLLRWKLERRLLPLTPMGISGACLLVMAAVSLWVSPIPELGWPKLYGILLGLLLYSGIVYHISNERQVRLIGAALVASALLVAVVGLIGTGWSSQKLLLLDPLFAALPKLAAYMPMSVLPSDRVGFHPNEVGGTLALLFPLSVITVTSFRGLARVSLAAISLIVLFVLLLTQSRSALIGVIVAIVFLCSWRRWWIGAAAVILLSIASTWFVWTRGLDSLPRLLLALDMSTVQTYREDVAFRFEIWARALHMVRDFPYTGIGLNTFPFVLDNLYPLPDNRPYTMPAHSHNIFLQATVDMGILGGLAFLGLIVSFWLSMARARTAWKDPRVTALITGLSAGMIAFLTYGLTDAVTLGAKPGIFFWAFLGLAQVLSRKVELAPRSVPMSIGPTKFVNWLLLPVFLVAIVLTSWLSAGSQLVSLAYLNLGSLEASRALSRGSGIEASGALNKAETVLSQASEYEPRNATPYVFLGMVNEKLGRYYQARIDLEKAVSLDPNDGWASDQLARFYKRIGVLVQ